MYLDTAILVKLFVREPESEWFERKLTGHAFDTSELALVEFRAALLAKERAGHLTSRERNVATGKFLTMVEDDLIRLWPLHLPVLERAIAIQLACHPRIPLRTLDALHVATCDIHHCGVLATTDFRMRAACEQLGIALIPEHPDDVTISR